MIKSIAKLLVLISAAFCIGVGVTFAPPAESALEWYCWTQRTSQLAYSFEDRYCYPAETKCCHTYTHECFTAPTDECYPTSE